MIKVRVRTPARTVMLDIDSRESLGALKKMVRRAGARRARGRVTERLQPRNYFSLASSDRATSLLS